MLSENYQQTSLQKQERSYFQITDHILDCKLSTYQNQNEILIDKDFEKTDQETKNQELSLKAKLNKKLYRKLQVLLSTQSAIFNTKCQSQLLEPQLDKQQIYKQQSPFVDVPTQKIICQNHINAESKRLISWRSIKTIISVFKHKNIICYKVQLKNKCIINVESFNLHRLCPTLVLKFYQTYPNIVHQQ